jgi:hypothetical protein
MATIPTSLITRAIGLRAWHNQRHAAAAERRAHSTTREGAAFNDSAIAQHAKAVALLTQIIMHLERESDDGQEK